MSEQDFVLKAKETLDTLDERTFFLGDADPDGLISTFLAASYLKESRRMSVLPRARFTRLPLDRFDIMLPELMGCDIIAGFDLWQSYQSHEAIAHLEKSKIRRLVVFDHHPSRQTEITTRLEVINPYLRDKKTQRCVTDLIFEVISGRTPRSEIEHFWRDLNVIGIVADHCVESSRQLIAQVALENRPHFQDLVSHGISDLSSAEAAKSSFRRAVDLFWAPYFVEGPAGVVQTYEELLRSEAFDLGAILSGVFDNPVLSRLAHLRDQMNSAIARIVDRPAKVFDLPRGKLVLVETESPYQEALVSNTIADQNPDWIVIVKSRLLSHSPKTRELIVSDSRLLEDPDRKEFIERRLNSKIVKYSIRRRNIDVNLARIVSTLGVGGGHPAAAGAIVKLDDESRIEESLITMILQEAREAKTQESPMPALI